MRLGRRFFWLHVEGISMKKEWRDCDLFACRRHSSNCRRSWRLIWNGSGRTRRGSSSDIAPRRFGPLNPQINGQGPPPAQACLNTRASRGTIPLGPPLHNASTQQLFAQPLGVFSVPFVVCKCYLFMTVVVLFSHKKIKPNFETTILN